jgi:hypothetical protein
VTCVDEYTLIPSSLSGVAANPYEGVLRRMARGLVRGYAFRGESRSPEVVERAGGFLPNAFAPGAKVPRDRDLFDFVHLKAGGPTALVSFSTSAVIATAYASPGGPFAALGTLLGRRPSSWVYACYVQGGYAYGKAMGLDLVEQDLDSEIVVPGGVEWASVVAYRDLAESRGAVFFREGFEAVDPAAFAAIDASLGRPELRH